MLVMDVMDVNLREYLQQNHNQLTWKKKINITFEIIRALYFIHLGGAIHMLEISSEQPPFINHEHDYNLAMNIINGIRPKFVLGTPIDYKNLMEQCWDANPSKRPDIDTLMIKIREMNLYYQNTTDESL